MKIRTSRHHSSFSPLFSEFNIKRCGGRRRTRRWWDLRGADLEGGCDGRK
ncbi:hypothetical protein YC2023_101857 [Brassica napus]|uniref:(rape) hypothetical protein n=1 Tax=Brassica napus TaxID=3708 RepID=A0A816UMX0_BRANA|nr:unnamed protein product [Brassica napus]